jgi:hypothetical protein
VSQKHDRLEQISNQVRIPYMILQGLKCALRMASLSGQGRSMPVERLLQGPSFILQLSTLLAGISGSLLAVLLLSMAFCFSL